MLSDFDSHDLLGSGDLNLMLMDVVIGVSPHNDVLVASPARGTAAGTDAVEYAENDTASYAEGNYHEKFEEARESIEGV